ncbi:hypothetical protein BDQ12DRAFT_688331 [Crucibulum laeve]|uniref:Uncharacterized protein n=1 Tax=Crucibulum laeve TaxID=68775 RepID=A0A5C3LQA1_9AGAR|nr:hypothetical protein BDQ12DRAFT_688331 [Crucibulum laeve]
MVQTYATSTKRESNALTLSLRGAIFSLTLRSVLFEHTSLPQAHTRTHQCRTLVIQISVDIECDVLYVLGIKLASASTAKSLAPTTMAMPSTSTTDFSLLCMGTTSYCTVYILTDSLVML